MSWGIRITILYLGFVALILTLAFTCFGQKVELESKDYYARELKFQSQIDAINNSNALATPLQHQVSGRSVELSFPAELLTKDLKGTVSFLRPSDSSKDVNMTIKPDAGGHQVLSDPSFVRGVYKMQVAFVSGGKNYYRENIVFLQ